MNKPSRRFEKPLSALLGKVLGDAFAKRGFASAELVTRWREIVGPEIAAHSEPLRIMWPRAASSRVPGSADRAMPEAAADQRGATVVLRVEGPAALEIQHLAGVICERINRFVGWRAIERVALRQAPLRGAPRTAPPSLDAAAVARVATTLSGIADEDLKNAVARLGAAVRRG